jgi:hypothetical protein
MVSHLDSSSPIFVFLNGGVGVFLREISKNNQGLTLLKIPYLEFALKDATQGEMSARKKGTKNRIT